MQTFKYELGVQFCFRMFDLIFELTFLNLSKEFFTYLETDGSELKDVSAWPVFAEGLKSTLDFMWMRHKGYSIIFLMVVIKIPYKFVYEKFIAMLCLFLIRLR